MDDRSPSAATFPERSNAGNNQNRKVDSSTEQSGSTTEQLRKPLEDVTSHATDAAGDVIEHAKAAAKEVVDHATQAAGETVAAVATDLAKEAPNMAQGVRERAGAAAEAAYAQGSEYVSRNVKTYPLTTLLIAGAVGYGLGYIFSRQ